LLVSLFAPLTAGLYWKKSSKTGAILSMVFGMIVYLICDWIEFEIQSHIFGLLASTFAMLVGSYLFPNPPSQNHELS
jgi:Na+/pantothenate symporter